MKTISEDDTLSTTSSKETRLKRGLALLILWSTAAPQRCGEIGWLPRGRDQRQVLLGRGKSQVDDPAPRLVFCQQRPGVFGDTKPILDPKISRQQILLEDGAQDSVSVKNLGRRKMTVNGTQTDSGFLNEGDHLAIGGRLLLRLIKRPLMMYKINAFPEVHFPEFGSADAFGLVGESEVAWLLRNRLAFVAARDRHLLILGQSGTGKELVATAIHQLSDRRDRTLISRNAATLPASLVDAELFGNAVNYPNPGMPNRPGLIGAANRSTLFLDEIGELPLDLQSHLLRVLDSKGEYHRLGEERTRRSDFRFVAATNRDPSDLRPDLLARFPLRLSLPELNERRSDIPLLIRFLLLRAAKEDHALRDRFFEKQTSWRRHEPRVSLKLVSALVNHDYSLHVRELETLLWQAMTTSDGQKIRLTSEVSSSLNVQRASGTDIRTITAEAIRDSLERHHGVQARVWRELGFKNRHVLRRLIRKFGLSVAGTDEGEF